MRMEYIPVYQPALSGKEKEYVNDCIDSTWISSKGSYIQRFEKKFAEQNNIQYATTVSNGTVALHLALLALGISEGDEVIVPTLTYIASVNAIKYTGATPVFVDSDLQTWQISVDDIKNKITSRTKAIMCVHLYGHPCDMSPILEIAKVNNLFIIEDCA
ncbi:DegT/DnrJ/EryC1/StrS aminotransferase family protein, partial [Salmonella enterica subsp. enterica serovar Ago]|nr:DegT/DnrJ/EryC1/StrS aminotransferase family protein [Salmonella enterica subsp. enterica serovar Ago]